MKFEEFKKNVEGWAEVRGIYAESTVEDQMELGLREFGEVITAENDTEWLQEIGDCIVLCINCLHFTTITREVRWPPPGMNSLSWASYFFIERSFSYAIGALLNVVHQEGFLTEECLDLTWEKIKDRKGMMINKKYVKWDNLNEDQRAEFTKREEERK